jgi:hypothetical protein
MVGMAQERVPGVPVLALVVEVIVALEQAVMQDHPVIAVADIRPQDRRADLAVVLGRQHVANVVQERADHGLLVGAILLRAGRGLQRVLVAIDPVAELVAGHLPEHAQQIVGQPRLMLPIAPA